jgi:hypothetical protein
VTNSSSFQVAALSRVGILIPIILGILDAIMTLSIFRGPDRRYWVCNKGIAQRLEEQGMRPVSRQSGN